MKRATNLPENIGPIHFVGIGGIGMSGIAEILIRQGRQVQGSDLKASKITDRLATLGAQIFVGQTAENVRNAGVVVISSAIKPGNAELDEARRLNLPVVRRAEMLAELMRLKSTVSVAGTHGKTTTTTMVATLLEQGGLDPTVVNGGVIHAFGSNARNGAGDWMVVEADESDGTFTMLPTEIAVITNIDAEHMEHYGDIDRLHAAFHQFASQIPFYGAAVCNLDHDVVKTLISKLQDRQVITYGFDEQADVRAENLTFDEGQAQFDITFQPDGERISGAVLPMPGEHNVSNALAAVAVARKLGIPNPKIKEALANFKGVNRRFTRVGKVDGITIIDDYAHHPVELTSLLKAARQATKGRVIAVHQPHRYSRLNDLFDQFCGCFDDADVIGITDIYAAGEDPIEGADRASLIAGLKKHGHKHPVSVPDENALLTFVKEHAQSGDLVVCTGAGTISAWANALPEKLKND